MASDLTWSAKSTKRARMAIFHNKHEIFDQKHEKYRNLGQKKFQITAELRYQ